MMQHVRALVHGRPVSAKPAPTPSVSRPSATDRPTVRRAEQELATTGSRRLRRHDFLRAVDWAINCGGWPSANHTTRRIALDLARRMNADGHVAYGRLALAGRLHISRRTVDRHIAVLRDIGLLVWVVHGSRKNTRPPHLPGWSGTATIYAATAPPEWDTAMGHRIHGTGYHARLIGFTPVGRHLAIAKALSRARSRQRPRDTPSLGRNPLCPQAKVERGKRSTPRRRTTSSAAATAVAVAAWIRPRVPWTQTESLRRLAFALRPWLAAGLSREEIAAELTSWWLSWRPRQPAAYVLSRWQARQRQSEPEHPAPGSHQPTGCTPNHTFLAAVEQLRTRLRGNTNTITSEADPPVLEIRARIRASLREASVAHLQRSPRACSSLAEWEALTDERAKAFWTHPAPQS
ncbi:hypothetical protein [Streptomyces sp. NPDC029674]|uniref:hypothetical protein n=1 Tax=Streptomyces sp. NPDC029674 TaxID=3365297 RepID=UPI00384D8E00